MADIKVLDDGPFQVSGGVTLVDGEGTTIDTKEQVYLCRCGLSANQPYCSGAHKGKLESKIRA